VKTGKLTKLTATFFEKENISIDMSFSIAKTNDRGAACKLRFLYDRGAALYPLYFLRLQTVFLQFHFRTIQRLSCDFG